MAMNHQQAPLPTSDPHRQLRIISICAFVPALALLLPCGIIANRPLPVIGIAPMFCSSLFQVITIGSRPRLPKTTVFINMFLAAFLFGILLPSWIFMAEGKLSYQGMLSGMGGPPLLMLGVYGTMPMMVNLMIHAYLALHDLVQMLWTPRSVFVCCCQNPSACVRPERNGLHARGKDNAEVNQPILRFYDEQARPSSDYQTSGCNTPRMSQETLEGSERQSGDLV